MSATRPIPQPRPWYPSSGGSSDWSPEWWGWLLIGAAGLLVVVLAAFVIAVSLHRDKADR